MHQNRIALAGGGDDSFVVPASAAGALIERVLWTGLSHGGPGGLDHIPLKGGASSGGKSERPRGALRRAHRRLQVSNRDRQT